MARGYGSAAGRGDKDEQASKHGQAQQKNAIIKKKSKATEAPMPEQAAAPPDGGMGYDSDEAVPSVGLGLEQQSGAVSGADAKRRGEKKATAAKTGRKMDDKAPGRKRKAVEKEAHEAADVTQGYKIDRATKLQPRARKATEKPTADIESACVELKNTAAVQHVGRVGGASKKAPVKTGDDGIDDVAVTAAASRPARARQSRAPWWLGSSAEQPDQAADTTGEEDKESDDAEEPDSDADELNYAAQKNGRDAQKADVKSKDGDSKQSGPARGRSKRMKTEAVQEANAVEEARADHAAADDSAAAEKPEKKPRAAAKKSDAAATVASKEAEAVGDEELPEAAEAAQKPAAKRRRRLTKAAPEQTAPSDDPGFLDDHDGSATTCAPSLLICTQTVFVFGCC
jgi:hypothetical protein